MNSFVPVFVAVASGLPSSLAQPPVIFPGGVVSAASYTAPATSSGDLYLAVGSIATIFGQNLAASTQTATTVPLPVTLGGTAVAIDGVSAPLFYASPNQINFEIPANAAATPGLRGVVVTTAAGASDPYPLSRGGASLGLFSLDASGCGRGDILNVRADGNLSLNSPANSVSPGDYLAAFGTGAEYLNSYPPEAVQPDGTPAPPSPLIYSESTAGPRYDFTSIPQPASYPWTGRAPGQIGVDQFNVLVSPGVRGGCAVPFQTLVLGPGSMSQPLTVAIRSGGGPCIDPPEAGYGQITWEKDVTTSVAGVVTESDTVSVSLQESPGKQAPPVSVYASTQLPAYSVYYGPSCPIPGYRSLDAGKMTVQGTGLSPVSAPTAPLTQGQAAGLTVYRATLPPGTIQQGNFTVAASGGADVAGFQSSVQIGAGIQISTDLTGIVFPCNKPVTINWTGGDPRAWVTINKVIHYGTYDTYSFPQQARVSDGTATLSPPVIGPPPSTCVITSPIELIVDVDPDPSEIATFSPSGLTLGGRHTWKYTYHFPAFYQPQ